MQQSTESSKLNLTKLKFYIQHTVLQVDTTVQVENTPTN